jgi:hypothetical protein
MNLEGERLLVRLSGVRKANSSTAPLATISSMVIFEGVA